MRKRYKLMDKVYTYIDMEREPTLLHVVREFEWKGRVWLVLEHRPDSLIIREETATALEKDQCKK